MELTDLQDRYLDELSGGQRQRAYIAMVIAQDTKYILLDEPLNNLDIKHSVEIIKILKRLVYVCILNLCFKALDRLLKWSMLINVYSLIIID